MFRVVPKRPSVARRRRSSLVRPVTGRSPESQGEPRIEDPMAESGDAELVQRHRLRCRSSRKETRWCDASACTERISRSYAALAPINVISVFFGGVLAAFHMVDEGSQLWRDLPAPGIV